MDVPAQDELRPRVGPQPALELGAVHEVAGIRKAGRGHPGRLGQEREVRRDDEEAGRRLPRSPSLADVLRRRRAATDLDTGDGDSGQLERLVVEQPDPVLAGALGELVAEADVVVPVHGRERSDVRRRQPGEDVLEIAQVRELDAVAQEQDQIDLSLGEPLERRVGAPVEVLGLEDVDPA